MLPLQTLCIDLMVPFSHKLSPCLPCPHAAICTALYNCPWASYYLACHNEPVLPSEVPFMPSRPACCASLLLPFAPACSAFRSCPVAHCAHQSYKPFNPALQSCPLVLLKALMFINLACSDFMPIGAAFQLLHQVFLPISLAFLLTSIMAAVGLCALWSCLCGLLAHQSCLLALSCPSILLFNLAFWACRRVPGGHSSSCPSVLPFGPVMPVNPAF